MTFPILNFFFKSKEATKEKTSLVFIVTPTSYDPTNSAANNRASQPHPFRSPPSIAITIGSIRKTPAPATSRTSSAPSAACSRPRRRTTRAPGEIIRREVRPEPAPVSETQPHFARAKR